MKFPFIPALILCVFAGSVEMALAVDQPKMKQALGYLKDAATPASAVPRSKKIDRAKLLKQARETLAKAPSIYDGRKADAAKLIDTASAQVKAGEENKAILTIHEAILKVVEGMELVDKKEEAAKETKPKKSSSGGSGGAFGVPKEELEKQKQIVE